MHIDVAGEAPGKTLVKHRSMRHAVTVAAGRYCAVPILVARGAGDGFVLTVPFLPERIDSAVTGTTDI